MSQAPSQAESQISASIPPLGEDALLLRHMTATEEIGRLFEYELELLSVNHGIKLKDVLGQNLTVNLALPDEENRFFNGHVSRFTYAGTHGEYARYVSTVRPWLWFLTRRSDCRIFQEMTVPDIIEDTFRRHGFGDFANHLTSEYRPWEYCVQYRETDFDFVSRLMEHEGIYYYFAHEDGKHTLVLCDGNGVGRRAATPGYERVRYLAAEDTDHVIEHVSDWIVSQQVEPEGIGLKDFDFKGPRARLSAQVAAHSEYLADGVPSQSDLEMYEYPGKYEHAEDGEAYARIRMEELEAQYEMADGQTNARGVAVGSVFELVDHPRAEANREYLVVSATYHLNSDAYGTTDSSAEEPTFRCGFRAIEATRRYRTPRTTSRPVVQGPQTAVVVGPEGEKVWPDNFGRVKVQFHWDRYGKRDENSSCWIRVSQSWAGSNWGGMHIPHVGQEVIVEFLEGDPDRPVITGRVNNAANMPPVELPKHKHKSVMRDDFGNELVFDATPGNEHIWLYSPSHESGIAIGKSVKWCSISDSEEIACGCKNEMVLGFKGETVAGFKSEAVGGTHTDLRLGASFQGSIGAAASVTWDRRITVVGRDDVDFAADDYYKLVNDIALLDAKGRMQLMAGDSRQTVVKMEKDAIDIAVQEPEARSGVIEKHSKGLKAALNLMMVTNMIAHGAYAGTLPSKAKEKEDDPGSDEAWTTYVPLGLHAVVAALAAGFAEMIGRSVDPDKIAKQTDEKGKASVVRLDDKGDVVVSGSGTTYLKGNRIVLAAQTGKKPSSILGKGIEQPAAKGEEILSLDTQAKKMLAKCLVSLGPSGAIEVT